MASARFLPIPLNDCVNATTSALLRLIFKSSFLTMTDGFVFAGGNAARIAEGNANVITTASMVALIMFLLYLIGLGLKYRASQTVLRLSASSMSIFYGTVERNIKFHFVLVLLQKKPDQLGFAEV